MKRFFWILIIIVFFLIAGGIWFEFSRPPVKVVQNSPKPQVCVNERCYEVQIAKTPTELERGLMNRVKLGSGSGMLFIFSGEDRVSFWMKNTLIPLDIVWIDNNYRVVFIKHNAEPCGAAACPTIDPGVDARYVLEVNAGEADRVGAKVGDLVVVKNYR